MWPPPSLDHALRIGPHATTVRPTLLHLPARAALVGIGGTWAWFFARALLFPPWEWGHLAAGALAALGVLVAVLGVAPWSTLRAEITDYGIKVHYRRSRASVEKSWARIEGFVYLHRTLTPNKPASWRIGVTTDDGQIIGLLHTHQESKARALLQVMRDNAAGFGYPGIRVHRSMPT